MHTTLIGTDLSTTVTCYEVKDSPEHHTHAPLYPEMIPEGSCQLQKTEERHFSIITKQQ